MLSIHLSADVHRRHHRRHRRHYHHHDHYRVHIIEQCVRSIMPAHVHEVALITAHKPD